MNKIILLICEGEKTELQIHQCIQNRFLKNLNVVTISASFSGEIYQLFNAIENDADLDVVELIRTKSTKNKDALSNIKRTDIAEVYLFFDYDNQSSIANDEQITKMLSLFNNETEKGKLYLSYPMVEAIRHFEEQVDFIHVCVTSKIKGKPYKRYISNLRHYNRNLNVMPLDIWQILISQSLRKAHYMTTQINESPKIDCGLHKDQSAIFEAQQKDHLPNKKIAVLSAYPFFLIDYFGNNLATFFIEQDHD